MDYSIIIPAYNEEGYLGCTLAAVRKAMATIEKAGEIIVVDNNSTDATSSIAEKHGVTVVFEPQNRIAMARNAGVAASTGNKLVFIDADTIVQPDTLRQAVESLSADVGAGGAHIVYDNSSSLVTRAVVAIYKLLCSRFSIAAGCFTFCRRESFNRVGGFDERVYAGEDARFSLALGRDARKNGLRFLIIKNPPVRTSARKLEWYNSFQLIGIALLMSMPFATRSRWLSRFWYWKPVRKTDARK